MDLVCIADVFYIVSDDIWTPGPNFMSLKNHDFMDFFMPKFSKDFGQKYCLQTPIGKPYVLMESMSNYFI